MKSSLRDRRPFNLNLLRSLLWSIFSLTQVSFSQDSIPLTGGGGEIRVKKERSDPENNRIDQERTLGNQAIEADDSLINGSENIGVAFLE
ncbi:hypothetical protein BVX99_01415 [bacterium F16]|nr:hypothetical protein BVX99_01415 [bacterium F16]